MYHPADDIIDGMIDQIYQARNEIEEDANNFRFHILREKKVDDDLILYFKEDMDQFINYINQFMIELKELAEKYRGKFIPFSQIAEIKESNSEAIRIFKMDYVEIKEKYL